MWSRCNWISRLLTVASFYGATHNQLEGPPDELILKPSEVYIALRHAHSPGLNVHEPEAGLQQGEQTVLSLNSVAGNPRHIADNAPITDVLLRGAQPALRFL